MVQRQEPLRKHLLTHYKYFDGELLGPRGYIIGGKLGYKSMTVTLNGKHIRLLVHRAIFLMCKGYLPDLVDHIDQNPRNNLICNLRDADKGMNAINVKAYKRLDGKLPRGVDRSGDKFTARMKVYGKKVHLGTFDTIEEASNAANLRRNEEFARRQAVRPI